MNASQTMQLIALVQKNPPLWDKECPGYKDSKAKMQAFEAIGAAINPPVSGSEAATRFKSLRDNLGKEYKKVQSSRKIPSGSGGLIKVYEPKWTYYSEMLFLKNYIHLRETKSNMTLNVEHTKQSINTTNDATIVELPEWLNLPEGFMDTIEPKTVSQESICPIASMEHDQTKIPLSSQKQNAVEGVAPSKDAHDDSRETEKLPEASTTDDQKSTIKSKNKLSLSIEDSC